MEKELIYIGRDSYEEYYINLKDKSLNGWSFMGLRPETEDNLRERQRETDIEDFCNIPDFLKNYINRNAFADDMEEEWLEHHDSQGEYNSDGETYYLGFGSGQDIFSYFKDNEINTYSDFINKFEEVNLNEFQFNELIKIMKHYKQDKDKGYSEFMKWQKNISEFPKNTYK